MEITETKMFSFTSQVEGQTFTFGIPANNRSEAAEILRRRLQAIIDELTAVENKKKSASSN